MIHRLVIFLLLLSIHYAISQNNLENQKEVQMCDEAMQTSTHAVTNEDSDIQPSDIPWLAAVYTKTFRGVEFLCSGTIISRNLVLTASHCYNMYPVSELVVYYGTRNLTDWTIEGGRKSSGVREILKPNTTSDSEGDIAVLVLSSVYTYKEKINTPVTLLQPYKANYTSLQQGWLSGWETEKNAVISTAKTLRMEILDRETCVKNDPIVAKQATGNMRCFQYTESEMPCREYSGSGIFMHGKPAYAVTAGLSYPAENWILRGVIKSVKRDDKMGDCDVISVYTDLVSYNRWLHELIDKYAKLYHVEIKETEDKEILAAKTKEQSYEFVSKCRDIYQQNYNQTIQKCNEQTVKNTKDQSMNCLPCNIPPPEPTPLYPTPPSLPPLLLPSTEDLRSIIKTFAFGTLTQGTFDLRTLNSNLTSEEWKIVEDLKKSSQFLLHDAFKFSLSITQTLLRLDSQLDSQRSSQDLKMDVKIHLQESVDFLNSVANIMKKIQKVEEIKEKTGTEVEFKFTV